MSSLRTIGIARSSLCSRAASLKAAKISRMPHLSPVILPSGKSMSSQRLGGAHLGSTSRSIFTSSRIHTATAVKREPAPTPATSEETVELPETNADDTRVAVGWPDGIWSRYHHFWLRDHCRCPECFHPVTKQRMVDTFALPPDLHPKSVVSTPHGLEVTCKLPWPTSPPHVSLYPWQWLRRNSYDPQTEPISIAGTHPPPEPEEKILWGAGIVRDPPSVAYEEVMHDEFAVYKWLEKIDRFGFCFISGVPATTEDTEKLVQRIAFIRHTQYGGFWDFTADLAHGDTAYTNIALPAHTDNSYFTDPCGLQMFHLLMHEQGTGGQTLLVDGFYAASILKELHPDSYELLSNVLIPTHSAGDEDTLYRARPLSGNPILRHDPLNKNTLIQVRYANDHRSAMRNVEPGMMMDWYNALRHWNSCLTSSDSEYWVQLSPGTVVVVDNHRVLHGRSAFTGKRRMCGAYVGLDDWRARLDALRGKYLGGNRDTTGRSVWDPAF
ncbi:related to trimethyllysine hydroxylase [Serendipita indica DSM 11827]|uniref:trimethyllysine dioxygenase n=1 Tax=Serendipita indica (strain DSM 11827) TaxID=1109443 RepID=G4TPV1_SERID|nr:related to trimethyllysine hydroxylase [Serendipita indica DSM 11827]